MKPGRRQIFVIAFAVLVLLLFVIPPHIRPQNYAADDAYFYLQVASNIYRHHGSTFNEITQTNGYHPLWMLLCVLSFIVSGGDKTMALHIVLAIQQLLAAGIIYLFYRISITLRLRYWPVVLPILFLYFSTRLYATEAYISGFLIMLSLCVSAASCCGNKKGYARYAVIGFIAGLAALARLDNVFVVSALFLFCALEYANSTGDRLIAWPTVKLCLYLFLPFLCVVGPYLTYNYVRFEHFVPISGAIKSAGRGLAFNINGLSHVGKICALFAVAGLLLSVTRFCDRRRRFILRILSSGFLLHATYIVLLTSHHTDWPWYYVAGVIGMAVSVCALTEIVVDTIMPRILPFSKTIPAYKIILVLSLLMALPVNVYSWMRYRNSAPTIRQSFLPDRLKCADIRWQEKLARWLKDNLPPQSRIYIYDWPGLIGYLSGHHILSPDGLINDYQYNDDILDQGISDYLKAKKIQYWLGPFTPDAVRQQSWYHFQHRLGGDAVEIFSPLYRKSAGTFTIDDTNSVVRFREVIQHQDIPDLGLWLLEHD